MLLCATSWGVVCAVNPYLLKLIIDAVVTYTGDPAYIWSCVAYPLTAFVALQVSIVGFMRLQEWIQLYSLFLTLMAFTNNFYLSIMISRERAVLLMAYLLSFSKS